MIIFGAGVRPDGSPSPTLARRVEAAWRWGEARGVPPVYLPSGGVGRHGPAEAEVMARLLRDAGVPAERILPEPVARDTLDTVLICRSMLRARRHRGGVRAATSAYHLPRCLLLLRLAGLPARAVPPPAGPASRRWKLRWYWRLREVPAIGWDALLLVLRRPRWDRKRRTAMRGVRSP
ncbi:YdcF family protein [Rhizosaccharibacter radicis]|uniref:YdcF family protein n=1 Tax=Rhizosaccharibacter radicis TaxID=2782605 RepID=UPI003BF5E3E8